MNPLGKLGFLEGSVCHSPTCGRCLRKLAELTILKDEAARAMVPAWVKFVLRLAGK